MQKGPFSCSTQRTCCQTRGRTSQRRPRLPIRLLRKTSKKTTDSECKAFQPVWSSETTHRQQCTATEQFQRTLETSGSHTSAQKDTEAPVEPLPDANAPEEPGKAPDDPLLPMWSGSSQYKGSSHVVPADIAVPHTINEKYIQSPSLPVDTAQFEQQTLQEPHQGVLEEFRQSATGNAEHEVPEKRPEEARMVQVGAGAHTELPEPSSQLDASVLAGSYVEIPIQAHTLDQMATVDQTPHANEVGDQAEALPSALMSELCSPSPEDSPDEHAVAGEEGRENNKLFPSECIMCPTSHLPSETDMGQVQPELSSLVNTSDAQKNIRHWTWQAWCRKS